jgi:hypothetical protein
MTFYNFLEVFLEIVGIVGGITLCGIVIAWCYFKLFVERKIRKSIPEEIKKEVENGRKEKERRIIEARRKYQIAANVGTNEPVSSGESSIEKPELYPESPGRQDIQIPSPPNIGELDNSDKPKRRLIKPGNQSVFSRFGRRN